mmetsp:Transcript_28432/g.75057  ORF Transcript_28432/g.75057 Transcript_28432/m.75057 type:complete len:323 (-) Transcript_28432:574-1542(-)
MCVRSLALACFRCDLQELSDLPKLVRWDTVLLGKLLGDLVKIVTTVPSNLKPTAILHNNWENHVARVVCPTCGLTALRVWNFLRPRSSLATWSVESAVCASRTTMCFVPSPRVPAPSSATRQLNIRRFPMPALPSGHESTARRCGAMVPFPGRWIEHEALELMGFIMKLVLPRVALPAEVHIWAHCAPETWASQWTCVATVARITGVFKRALGQPRRFFIDPVQEVCQVRFLGGVESLHDGNLLTERQSMESFEDGKPRFGSAHRRRVSQPSLHLAQTLLETSRLLSHSEESLHHRVNFRSTLRRPLVHVTFVIGEELQHLG